jgi:hypothetical protein
MAAGLTTTAEVEASLDGGRGRMEEGKTKALRHVGSRRKSRSWR